MVLPTSPSDSRGFTLVELMCAMLIMSVGLFGLLQSVSVAYEHNARNKLREEAVQIAEEHLNQMRARPYDNISITRVWWVQRPIGRGFNNFSVTWQSEEIGGVIKNSKKLTVDVIYRFKNVRKEHVIYTMKNK